MFKIIHENNLYKYRTPKKSKYLCVQGNELTIRQREISPKKSRIIIKTSHKNTLQF